MLTDRFLETSAPGVFAAGDIAEYDSVVHGRRLRIEHWDVAFNQGKYAALNMLGKQQEYDVVPYFWSDLADWIEHGVRRAGRASGTRSGGAAASDEGKFTAWYVKDGEVAAALTVGRSDDLAVAGRLLAARPTCAAPARADRGSRRRHQRAASSGASCRSRSRAARSRGS